jgi:Zn-dependent protease
VPLPHCSAVRKIAQILARLQSDTEPSIVPRDVNLSAYQVRWVVIDVLILVAAVTFHEFGHAFAAHKLGDDTPSRQGRVTLNPLAHADPIGTLLLPLIGGIYGAAGGIGGGFGWGRPVEWQPSRVSRKWRMSVAQVIVALAGPSMNVFLGVAIAGVHGLLYAKGAVSNTGEGAAVLKFAATTNFVLFFFNLVPVPPLDGGHVIEHFIPYKQRANWESVARYGPFIVLAIAAVPQLARVFLIPAQWCTSHLYGLFGVPYYLS